MKNPAKIASYYWIKIEKRMYFDIAEQVSHEKSGFINLKIFERGLNCVFWGKRLTKNLLNYLKLSKTI